MKIENKGPQAVIKYVQQSDRCCSCGACLGICPYFKYHAGSIIQVFDCDFDIGRCHAFCPQIDVDYEAISRHLLNRSYQGSGIGYYQKIVSAKAGRKLPEVGFQGGGTVSGLMGYGMENGWFDGCIVTGSRNGTPEPRIAVSTDEILDCTRSKFTATPTLSALNRAIKEGFKKIGLVGIPCQITAVAQMKTKKDVFSWVNNCEVFTIGLFCNWAFSPSLLPSFLTEKYGLETITDMDIPPPPADVLIVKTREKEERIPLNEVRPLIDPSCSSCIDLTSEWADLSVGMHEEKPGWNTLIIRSEKGKNLVDHACESGFITIESMPENQIEHLEQAGKNKKKRALSAALDNKQTASASSGGVA